MLAPSYREFAFGKRVAWVVDDGTDFLLGEPLRFLVGSRVGRLVREGLGEEHTA
jgi:hypothetical protein